LSNLQRQIIHTEDDIGRAKVLSAADSMTAINSEVKLDVRTHRMEKEELNKVVEKVDVVVDCSDNLATRFLLNEVTQKQGKPLVSGAAIRMEGQVTVYDSRQPGNGCYQCLYQDKSELQETCSQTGVLSPLLGIIGSIQAVETVKLITQTGKSLVSRLLLLDASTMQWHEIRLKPNKNCPICQ